MRWIGVIILVSIIVVSSGSVVHAITSDNLTEVPEWITARQQVGYAGYSSSGSFNGHVDVSYSVVDASWSDLYYDENQGYSWFSINAFIRADKYGGYVSYTPNYPFVYTKVTVIGSLNYIVDYTAVTDSGTEGMTEVHSEKIIFDNTLFAMYHPSDTASLLVRLEVMYYEGSNVQVLLYWYRVSVNETTGELDIEELGMVTDGIGTTVKGPLTVELIVRPNFYTITVDNNETYMIYGYKGKVKFYVADNIVGSGDYQFAWDSIRLGPKDNVTADDVRKFTNDMKGWYIWVGGGLDYYVPDASRLETLPHWDSLPDEYYFPIGVSTPIEGHVTDIQNFAITSFDYILSVSIDYLYVENWITDPELLYAAFITGNLEEYRGAYMNIRAVGNQKIEYAVKALIPVAIASLLWGAFWRTRWAAYVFFITVVGLGVGLKIYGVPEATAALLALAAGHYLQHANNVGGENE